MKSRSIQQPSLRILLLDLSSIIISFLLAAFIRFGELHTLIVNEYSLLFIIVVMANITLFYTRNTSDGFFRRGFLPELKWVVRQNIIIALCLMAMLFLTKRGAIYARLFFAEFFFINSLLSYLFRQYYKIIMLAYFKKSGMSNKVMLITTYQKAFDIISNLKRENLSEHLVTTIAILDRDLVGKKLYNIPIKANINNLIEVIRYEVIDEVFICLPPDFEINLEVLIEELQLMGIVVKLNIDIFGLRVREKKVQSFSKYQVLIFSVNEFQVSKLFLKRIIDIIGAIVGLVCTALIFIFVAPAIYIESPGPIFFSQTRIGKNGRHFKIYKFRSMYPDAEARKAQLLALNEMQGYMFKMTNDPRVTKVGKFLRKTSLDEFPQFFNVLVGDMSLVGTRPPTVDEFLQYEGRHKRRLTLRPGITGLWQVSGRSDIENFEDVVKMDLEYIDNWSLLLDAKLLVKTVFAVLFRIGAK